MNTIRIYLTESGRIADLQKDFPLYQGQFQNKLLNVFVPTSILAPIFTSSGAVSADYVASTSTKIGMTYTARDGSIKTSKNYYMRYLKTLMYKGVEYALYERKLPKEFTFYAGQGENSPVLIINVVNIEQQSGDTPPLVLSVITSQTCHLDVMQSTFLDRDELNEPSELENLNAQVQALNAIMPLKQDKEDNNIDLKQKPVQKTVVGAINDLGELVETAQTAADANKTEMGNLSALTTDEKATLVGAINEVDNHADNAIGLANNAVATANGAVATANEAKTTAQTAETNANNAVDKATEAQRKAQEAITKAENNVYAVGFMTLQEAITAVNGYDNTVLKTNDNILVVAQGSPDLYVTSVEATNIPYNFTTVDKFNDDLVKNTVLQIGYYKVAFYETDGQPVTVAYQNVVVKSTDWVASTEFADFPYEAKIPLSNFVDYKTVPQVVFDIADTMSGNYAPICKSGDKCVYIYGKVQNEITLKTVITFAPNVNGASVTGGGYNNRGKWVASTTYEIDDLVYTDNGQFVCIEGITSTTSPEQDTTHWQATFVATGKTKNGLKFSGQDNGTGVQKTFDGSTAVEIAFDETTMTAKEVNGVLKVGAKGTIPEALPQEASALKNGSLPTNGWNTLDEGWKENTLPASRGWTSVTYGDGKYVAVASNSVGAYSTDGITWTEMSMEPNDWRSIAYGNGKFVAIASNSDKGAYSTDGITWAEFTLPANRSWNEVTYGNGKFVAVASGTNKGAYSTDGITWREMSMPANRKWHNVTYGNGKFVTVVYSSSTGAYSSDGINWTEMSLAYSRTWQSVTYGNGTFVALTSSSNDGIYSTDGISWTRMVMPANRDWYSVTYSNGKFVAVASGSDKGAYSTDGINWTEVTLPASSSWVSVTYGDGKFVAVAYNSANGAYWKSAADVTYTISDTSITANSDVLMELTDDGGVKAYSMEAGKMTVIRDTVPTSPIPYTYKVKQTNASGQFTLVNHFVPNIPESPTSLPVTYKKVSGELPTSGWTTLDEGWKENTLPASRNWKSVTYGNGKYVAVAWDSDKGAYSTDGITWTEMGLPASQQWQSVTYGNGKFVAVVWGSGNGAYSTDGINWTSTTMPASRNWKSVTYGNDKFVAIATSSTDKGAYSADGINWVEMTLPASRDWSSVTYGNGKFVAVASSNGGKGAYSTDGINWTEMSMLVDYKTFQSVTYGNGKFVAVSGGSNKGAYSADGITWTEMGMSTTSRSWSVTYGNDKFVAVAYGSSEVVYSTNGIDWRQTSSYSRSWNDVTYGNGKFVAIASNDLYYEYWETAVTYAISDTSITANTSVKMYLTDAGGVKAYSKANGSIQVIRDTVPTTAIPYEYEVEQTSAEGLFEVINAYVPDVPTKTSQLTNDSGFITAADIPSAGEWVDVTGETATLTQAGTYQVIASVNDMQSIVYWDGSTVAYGTKSTTPSVSTSGGTAYLFINCAYPQIDASGTLSVHLLTAGNSSGAWTETDTVQSGFKYRKIN